MTAESLPTSALRASVRMTPKEDTEGVVIKLKVFWKTTRFWTEADVADFQNTAPSIAEQLRTALPYWNKDGNIRTNRFTCEDFAIRILCEYAAPRGLPVKLTTGVRAYRNMEMYDAEQHDRYSSTIYGFAEMVMLTYGAPDMQRTGVNTIAVATPEQLLPGDILARANDAKGQLLAKKQEKKINVAHHIQIVIRRKDLAILIYQGNSDSSIHWPLTWINRLFLKNPADPQDDAYGGMKIEQGAYIKNRNIWDYKNITTGKKTPDLLKEFLFYRWNFYEFNK
jgi:hypothetical protein